MFITLYFDSNPSLISYRSVTPVELGECAHCFSAWEGLERIQLEAGGDLLNVAVPMTEASLDGWLKTHPRIVNAYRIAHLTKESELDLKDACLEFNDGYGVTIGGHYYVRVG